MSASVLKLRAQFRFLSSCQHSGLESCLSFVGSRVHLLVSFLIPHELSVPSLCSSGHLDRHLHTPKDSGTPAFVWLTRPSWVGASPLRVWMCFQASLPWGRAGLHCRLSCHFLQTEFPKRVRLSDSKLRLCLLNTTPPKVPTDVTSLLDGEKCSWLGEREFWKQCDPLLGACLPWRLFCFIHCRANS